MKKTIITIGIIVLLLVGLIYVLNKNKAKNKAQTDIAIEKSNGVAVRATDADSQVLNMEYIANGIFAPKQAVYISTEVPGKVVDVLVQEGTKVSAGQVLAVIKSDKQEVALANAQAVYNNALSESVRFENAYSSGGVTKQQLDQVKLQLENAKNNLQSAKINAGDVNITASFAGIVNKRNIEPGAFVSPGQQLFEIVNISSLKLRVNVDEKTVGSILTGENVFIQCSAIPTNQWKGKVTFIAPKADAGLNFPVELEIQDNEAGNLRAGMYGTAVFGKDQSVKTLVVPQTAFVGNISSNRIFIVQDGKAVLKTVTTGRDFGTFVEILSGIQRGDKVITSGQINLIDQTPVRIIQ
ncbi:MAG: efflux RND transporter periplasmic adaptor subunit [Bacteroidia bacterium]|nr:efflux RND transporter periplasmic adaptor subunit [Bacteroidia bacterium]MCO5253142.1 efflux RND transporter periplasmic adaptor subunit [Bacteroidota bacterium]